MYKKQNQNIQSGRSPKIPLAHSFVGWFVLPLIPISIYGFDVLYLNSYINDFVQSFFLQFHDTGLITGSDTQAQGFHKVILFLTILGSPFIVLYWFFFGTPYFSQQYISVKYIFILVGANLFFLMLYGIPLFADANLLVGSRHEGLVRTIRENTVMFHMFGLWPIYWCALIFSSTIRVTHAYFKHNKEGATQ